MDPNKTQKAKELVRRLHWSMEANGDEIRKPLMDEDRRQSTRRAEDQGRTLTDEDVAAIVDSMADKLEDRLYRNIGKGIWSLAQKAFIGIVLALAFYGSMKGIK